MDTTWVDVASDAVKIGLGALIGALSTIVSAHVAHMHNRKHDYSTRRRTRLEEVMPEFDEVSLKALNRVVRFLHAISNEGQVEVDVDTTVFDFESEKEAVLNINSRMNTVESKIALLDYPELAAEVEKFRATFRSLLEMRSASWEYGQEKFKELDDRRYKIIEMFAKAYRNA